MLIEVTFRTKAIMHMFNFTFTSVDMFPSEKFQCRNFYWRGSKTNQWIIYSIYFLTHFYFILLYKHCTFNIDITTWCDIKSFISLFNFQGLASTLTFTIIQNLQKYTKNTFFHHFHTCMHGNLYNEYVKPYMWASGVKNFSH